MSTPIPLGRLRVGHRARIVKVGGVAPDGDSVTDDSSMIRALLEMGILEGSVIRVVHEAPISRDPIAVEVRGGLIALRRQEADCISVLPLSENFSDKDEGEAVR